MAEKQTAGRDALGTFAPAFAHFNDDVLFGEVWSRTDKLSARDRSIGAPNDGFAKYFTGKSYLAPLSTSGVGIFNVTFAPGCRNFWHTHEATRGGGQILVCVGGRGIYREWGKAPQALNPGDVVNIPAGVKHWHGAAADSWFSHLAIEVPGESAHTEWFDADTEV